MRSSQGQNSQSPGSGRQVRPDNTVTCAGTPISGPSFLPMHFGFISSISVYYSQISWNLGVLTDFICSLHRPDINLFIYWFTSLFPVPPLSSSVDLVPLMQYPTASLEQTSIDLATLFLAINFFLSPLLSLPSLDSILLYTHFLIHSPTLYSGHIHPG